MAQRWKLKRKFQGKRGGVTLNVPGSAAGKPDAPVVRETLRGNEVIEGDHWEAWSEFLTKVAEVAPEAAGQAPVEEAAPSTPVKKLAEALDVVADLATAKETGLLPPGMSKEEVDAVMEDPTVKAAVEATIADTVDVDDGPIALPAADDEPERAREEDGTFKADDPATPDVNEAYVEPAPEPVKPAPKKRTRKPAAAKKAPAKKRTRKPAAKKASEE